MSEMAAKGCSIVGRPREKVRRDWETFLFVGGGEIGINSRGEILPSMAAEFSFNILRGGSYPVRSPACKSEDGPGGGGPHIFDLISPRFCSVFWATWDQRFFVFLFFAAMLWKRPFPLFFIAVSWKLGEKGSRPAVFPGKHGNFFCNFPSAHMWGTKFTLQTWTLLKHSLHHHSSRPNSHECQKIRIKATNAQSDLYMEQNEFVCTTWVIECAYFFCADSLLSNVQSVY